MRIKDSLKDLGKAFGVNVESDTFAGILSEIAVGVNPLVNLTIDTDIEADTDLLGKVIGDLQSNIKIGKNSISGFLKYVDDYTGFSGDAELQTGNYIAVHASVPDVEGVTITAKITNQVTLDSDGIFVGYITDSSTQTITFTASKEGYATVTKSFTLKGLYLEED